jgi:hypothetical protein
MILSIPGNTSGSRTWPVPRSADSFLAATGPPPKKAPNLSLIQLRRPSSSRRKNTHPAEEFEAPIFSSKSPVGRGRSRAAATSQLSGRCLRFLSCC